MIYDPSRRPLMLRQRILETMSAEEIEEWAPISSVPGYRRSAASYTGAESPAEGPSDERHRDPEAT